MDSLKHPLSLAFLLLNGLSVSANQYYVGGVLQNQQLMLKSTSTYPLASSAPSVASSTPALHTLGFGPTIGFYHGFKHSRWGIDTSLNLTYNIGHNKQSIQRWFNTTDSRIKTSAPLSTRLIAAARFQWQPKLALLAGPELNLTEFKSKSGVTGGNIGVTGSYAKQALGYGVALGVDYKVNQRWHCRLTDNAVYFSTFSWLGKEPISQSQLKQTYKPSGNTVQLSVLANL